MSEDINHLPEEFDLLKESKTRLTYFRGETIYKQGAFAPYVIYIVDGLARISLQTGPGKQINLRLAGKGDFIALSAIFGENRYVASAIALKDTLTCMIDKESLITLFKDYPDLALKLNVQSYQDEFRLLSVIRSLSYNQMRGKLAGALLYLSEDRFLTEDVFEYLTRQDLADFAGVSQESTVRYLKEFDSEGIIQLDGKNIHIRSREKLSDLSLHG